MNEKTEKSSLIGRRLLATLLDFIILFCFSFFFYFLVSKPIVSSSMSIPEIREQYKTDSDEYDKILDEYGVYMIDETGKRVIDESFPEEKKAEVLNDTRVIALQARLKKEANTISLSVIYGIIFALSLSSILVYMIVPLIFKGRSIGKICLKTTIVDDKSLNYARWYQVLLRSLSFIILDVFIGICTLFLYDIVDLIMAINSKDNRSLVDRIAGTRVVDNSIPIQFLK